MGLDIRAYRRVSKLDVIFDEDGEAIDKQTLEHVEHDVRVYANPDFPGREEGVEDRRHVPLRVGAPPYGGLW